VLQIIFAFGLFLAAASPAFAADQLRIGVQKTGTFAWQLDVIRRHNLADVAELNLKITELSSPDAGKLALNANSVDIAVVDWLWVARERASGTRLQFYPYSTAVGAIMTKNDAPLKSIADLKGRTLSVAGGPLDKSWLIIQAAASRHGIELKRDVTLQYGAPPLIFQKALQGEAQASLNYWNFCARLEAQGFRRLYDVRDAQIELGMTEPVALTGYVFSEEFAAVNKNRVDRFLSMVQQANDILLHSDAEWESLRPLMQANDQATFIAYRDRTRESIPRRSIDAEEDDAKKLFNTLAEVGGPSLVGPAKDFPPGLYYRSSSRGE
jgi:NitT/TauT family transport system substrate-binding protein